MKKILLALLAAALTGGTVHAVTLATGTMETRLEGNLDPTTPAGTLIEAAFSYGYFFADNLQAGGRVGLRDDDNLTSYNAALFTEYNFEVDSEDWLPFVEGSLGLSHNDIRGFKPNDTAVVLEVQGGIKYFIAPNVAISSALVLDWASEEIYADEDKLEDMDARLQFALRYYY